MYDRKLHEFTSADLHRILRRLSSEALLVDELVELLWSVSQSLLAVILKRFGLTAAAGAVLRFLYLVVEWTLNFIFGKGNMEAADAWLRQAIGQLFHLIVGQKEKEATNAGSVEQ